MFTGLIESLATVRAIIDEPPGKRLVVAEPRIAAEAAIGESIAVSGCCLTVVAIDGDALAFQAGPETLSRTTLGALRPGDFVNLERSLRVGDRVGGHFVAGHIDGVGSLVARHDESEWSTCWFAMPGDLADQLASKGSIAVDGVSLTLVEVTSDRFSVALIPHTLAVTTLGKLRVGNRVNLETDVLAKYVQRAVTPRSCR